MDGFLKTHNYFLVSYNLGRRVYEGVSLATILLSLWFLGAHCMLITNRLLSCSICWMDPDLRIPSGVAAAVGRCQVVVRFT